MRIFLGLISPGSRRVLCLMCTKGKLQTSFNLAFLTKSTFLGQWFILWDLDMQID